jgi:hypothetical protein
MKRIGLMVGLLLAAMVPVWGQVTVEVRLDQEQFLPGEAMPLTVRITNRSGETLALGANEDWLTFTIEAQDEQVVPKLGDAPVAGPFLLESSKVAIKHVDVAPFFSFGQSGHYRIVATVRIPGWDHDLTSAPKSFDVIEGAKLWERDFGVPRAGGSTNEVPEVRRYMLQQANYIRGQLRLYLRVMDTSGKVLKVLPIGGMLSFSRPEPQLDKFSNLHVLYQSGPHTFMYTQYSPDGELIARQYYEYVNARPHLRLNEEGDISVAGGVRRQTGNDFPPAPPIISENTPSTSPPPAAVGDKSKKP